MWYHYCDGDFNFNSNWFFFLVYENCDLIVFANICSFFFFFFWKSIRLLSFLNTWNFLFFFFFEISVSSTVFLQCFSSSRALCAFWTRNQLQTMLQHPFHLTFKFKVTCHRIMTEFPPIVVKFSKRLFPSTPIKATPRRWQLYVKTFVKYLVSSNKGTPWIKDPFR